MDLTAVMTSNPYKKKNGKGKGNEIRNIHPPNPRQMGKLTEEEKIFLRVNNGCFKCRQLGHWTKQCPFNKNNNTPQYTAPVYPAMPVYNHKVSRKALKLNSIQTMTDDVSENEESQ
jgi:hypothetical protein